MQDLRRQIPDGAAYGHRSGDLFSNSEKGRRIDNVDKSRIALVSLCDYQSEVTNLATLSTANKLEYARKHGYQIFMEYRSNDYDNVRPIAWSKIKVMQKYLRARIPVIQDPSKVPTLSQVTRYRPAFDWVVWLDCDTFLMNISVPIHEVARLYAGEETNKEKETSLVISADGIAINTGIHMHFVK